MWYDNKKGQDLESNDPIWSKKLNKVYWAGSTTGCRNREHLAGEPSWQSHRPRFVEMTRQLSPDRMFSFLAQQANGVWTKYSSNEILGQLYNTKFSGAVQCDEKECERMKEYYQIGEPEDRYEPFKYRLLMDLDGNTFSGRFYDFLRSHSCPLKQTIFREWHDERLYPWVHYVPVSTGMEDLPEIVRYLALTDEGSAIAKTIADNGIKAYERMLRREDMAIYLYRLFLEFGRVSSDGRTS